MSEKPENNQENQNNQDNQTPEYNLDNHNPDDNSDSTHSKNTQNPQNNQDYKNNPNIRVIRKDMPMTGENWERQTLRDVLFAAYQEQKRARVWKNIWRGAYFLLAAGLIFSAFNGGNAGDKSKNFSSSGKSGKSNKISKLAQSTGEHTAVIDLTGVIGGDDYVNHVEILRDGLTDAYDNPNVKGIIIRANSPGGSPVVSNIAFEEVMRLRQNNPKIPVYVVAEDLCASGCYYIAAAADKIYADPSSIVGSIGVIGSSFDATGLMEKLGIKRRLRTAGSNKGMGDPFSPETPEQQAIWQQMLTQIHEEFIKAVKTGRGDRLKEQDNPDLFSGRVYTGIEAKKVGLIDDLGNIYSVSRDVIQAPELVDYTPKQDDLMRLLSRGLRTEFDTKIQELKNKIWY